MSTSSSSFLPRPRTAPRRPQVLPCDALLPHDAQVTRAHGRLHPPHLQLELLDTRTRVEVRMRDVEEKLEDMDAKFEQNIAAMNELLQKNLKLLKHMA